MNADYQIVQLKLEESQEREKLLMEKFKHLDSIIKLKID